MRLSIFSIFFVLAASCNFTFAETNVWDGDNGVDESWSNDVNWVGGVAPVSATNLTLQFAGNVNMGSTGTHLDQDISDPLVLNRLDTINVASGDQNIYIDGLPLQFVADGSTQPEVFHNRENVLYFYNEVNIPAGVILNNKIRTYGMEYRGIITGNGILYYKTNGGAGELNLHNSGNTYSGGTVYVNTRGTDASWSRLKVYASNALGSGPVSISGGNITANGTTQSAGLTFYGSTTHTNDFLLQAASPIFAGVMNGAPYPANESVTLSGDFDLNSYTLYLRGHKKSEGFLSGVISEGGADALKKIDPGAWTLSGANTFTGKVTITDGTLITGTEESIPSDVSVSVEGGSYNLNGLSITNGPVSISDGSIDNGTLTADSFDVSGGSIQATLDSDGGLTKTGSSTATLSSSNLYSGATSITEGTLHFEKRTALYNGNTSEWTSDNLSVSSGATMLLNAGGTGEFTDSDVALLSGLGSLSGGFQSGSVLALDTTNAQDSVFSCESVTLGDAGGNGLSITKLGPGTLVMGDDNSYTGVTRLEEGTVSTAVLADGGTASGIGMSSSHRDNLIFAGGTLRYTGPSARTDRGFRYAVNTNYYTFDVTQPDTVLTFGSVKNALFDSNNTTIMKTGPGTLVFGRGTGTTYNFPVKSIYLMEGTFLTESGNHIQHNLHSTASQGPALVMGDDAELGFNNPMENYVDGGEMMVQYIGTQSCARITASSWLLCGPSSTNSMGVLRSNTHIFDINDGTDEIDLEISSLLGIYPSRTPTANSHMRKTGEGTLRLKHNLNRFRGTTIIRNGRIIVTSNVPKGGDSVLGNCTNDVVIGDAGTQANETPTFAFEGTETSNFSFDRGIITYSTGGVSSIGSISNNNVTFSGAITVSNTLQIASVSNGDKAITISGEISGPGGITASGTGTVILTASNTYTGSTTIAAGTLKLSEAERIADTSSLRLTGGTFDTEGYNETLNTLDVDGDATLDFGSGASEIHFSASALENWTGTLLMVNKTQGSDRLFVGTDANGLTEDQLSRIVSPNGQESRQLATGEVIAIPMGTVIIVR